MNHRGFRMVVIMAAVVTGIFLIAIYFCFDPASSDIPFPQCPSKLVTGYDCPGCGTQRALHALLNGDLSLSVKYNAMLIPSLLMICALVVASGLKKRYPGFHAALNSTISQLIVLGTIIVWTVIRNIIHL